VWAQLGSLEMPLRIDLPNFLFRYWGGMDAEQSIAEIE